MRILAPLSLVLVAACLAGCPASTPPPQPPAPSVASFTASPSVIAPGAPVTLSWDVRDAASVEIAEIHTGAVAGVDNRATGTVEVTPAASALYVLTALNSVGVKVTAVASVTVRGEGPSVVFTAVPPVLEEAQSGLLVWSAPGAKQVSIAPENGAPLDLKGQVESGQVEVNPVDTEMTFILTADDVTAQVVVRRAPVIAALGLSKTSALPGSTVTVTWTTRHAGEVALSAPGLGQLFTSTDAAQVASGSFDWVVPELVDGALVTLNLDATGPGGTVRQSVVFVVGEAPKLTSLTAPRYPRLGGDFIVRWTSVNATAVEVRDGTLVLWRSGRSAEALSGSVVLPTPPGTKTYTVAALRGGLEDTRPFTVYPVGPVSIATFTVTPNAVAQGLTPVTLTWNTPNARRVRVQQGNGLTVVWVTGPQAESGTATAYVNAATTRFTLTADNTLDAPLTATADATATTVFSIGAVDGGQVFENAGTMTVDWPAAGSELEGVSYSHVDTVLGSTGFDDISQTGTPLSFNDPDDGVAFFTAPGFETFLYGVRTETVARATVSVNGAFSFRGWGFSFLPPPFPVAWSDYFDFSVCPFYADLLLGANGQGFWQVKGEAPNQKLIIQWDRVALKGVATSELTFQLQVTQSGVVTFEYRTLKDLPAAGTFNLLVSAQGNFGRGVRGLPSGQLPSVGTGLRLFAPRERPLSSPGNVVPFTSFVKVGQGLAPISVGKVVGATQFHVSEVMAMPAAAVPQGEWFEVHNGSPQPVDLGGWVIDFGFGNTHVINRSVVVPPGGNAVLGQTANTALNDGLAVDYAYGPALVLQDAGGTVTLRSGGMAFGVTYGAATEGVATVFDPTPVIGNTTTATMALAPCPAVQTYGAQVPPQRGSPGSYHSCRGYVWQRIDGKFQDVSATGTRANLQAPAPYLPELDGYAQIDVSSAPVSLFGQSYPLLTASVKGVLVPYAYSASGGPWVYTYAGTLNGAIAPMWTNFDFQGRPDAGIFYQRFGPGQSTVDPRPHWVVQWKDMSHAYVASFNDHISFEVKFFDTGDLEYHYGELIDGSSRGFAQGINSVVWLERMGVPEGLAFSIKTPSLTSNMGLRYSRVP